MPNRWLTVAISLFWVTMMGLLIRRDILPYWTAGRAPDLRATAAAVKVNPQPARWDILLGQQRIGTVRTEWQRKRDGWLQFRSYLNISKLPILSLFRAVGVRGQLRCDSWFDISPQGDLERFRMDLRMAETKLRVRGRREADVLHVSFRSGSFVHEQQLYYPPHGLVGSSLAPIDRLPNLKLGQQWSYQVLNPLRRTAEKVECKVVSEQVITWRGEPLPTKVVEQRYGNFQARCWVADDGTVVRQELPFGLDALVFELQ